MDEKIIWYDYIHIIRGCPKILVIHQKIVGLIFGTSENTMDALGVTPWPASPCRANRSWAAHTLVLGKALLSQTSDDWGFYRYNHGEISPISWDITPMKSTIMIHLSLTSINTAPTPKYCHTGISEQAWTAQAAHRPPGCLCSSWTPVHNGNSWRCWHAPSRPFPAWWHAMESRNCCTYPSNYPENWFWRWLSMRFGSMNGACLPAPRPVYSRFFHSTRLSQHSSCHCSRCYRWDMGFARWYLQVQRLSTHQSFGNQFFCRN